MAPNRRPYPQFLTCHDVVFGTSPLDTLFQDILDTLSREKISLGSVERCRGER